VDKHVALALAGRPVEELAGRIAPAPRAGERDDEVP
jgi:hypothetical protein